VSDRWKLLFIIIFFTSIYQVAYFVAVWIVYSQCLNYRKAEESWWQQPANAQILKVSTFVKIQTKVKD